MSCVVRYWHWMMWCCVWCPSVTPVSRVFCYCDVKIFGLCTVEGTYVCDLMSLFGIVFSV